MSSAENNNVVALPTALGWEQGKMGISIREDHVLITISDGPEIRMSHDKALWLAEKMAAGVAEMCRLIEQRAATSVENQLHTSP